MSADKSPHTSEEHTPLHREILNKRNAVIAGLLIFTGAAARYTLQHQASSVEKPTFNVAPVTDEDFDEKVLQETDTPVLVTFGAEWCIPCKIMDPMIHELEQRYGGKLAAYHMDIESNTKDDPYILDEENESPIPRTIVFVNGEPRINIPGGGSARFNDLAKSVEKLLSEKTENQ